MKRTLRGACAALALVAILPGCGNGSTGASAASSPLTEVPGVSDPDGAGFPDPTNAIGFYTDGSIEDPTTIPDAGEGFLKVFRLRNRNFATATLVRTIALAAAAWRLEFPVGDRVQIGDSTDSNGGYLSGHASHQNGLDVDIAYLKTNRIERDPNTSGPNGFAESFVKNGVLTSNFDLPRNWAILRNLVLRGNVGRIFVDPAIKAALCRKSAVFDPSTPTSTRNEVLRRLRPYANHDDHFHLRLKCPVGHKKCVKQSEPPAGNGCASVASSGTEAENRTLEQIADDELGEDEG